MEKKKIFLKTFDIPLNSSNCFNSTERSGRLLKLFSDKLIQMSPRSIYLNFKAQLFN